MSGPLIKDSINMVCRYRDLIISWLTFSPLQSLNSFLNWFSFEQSPWNKSDGLFLRQPVSMFAAAAIMFCWIGIIGWGVGSCDANGCTGCASGNGGGTFSPASIACSTSYKYAGSSSVRGFSGSLSWISNLCWSCATRTGSSACGNSDDGSSKSFSSLGVLELSELVASVGGLAVVNSDSVRSLSSEGTCVETVSVGVVMNEDVASYAV
jgi:hypothetical protein